MDENDNRAVADFDNTVLRPLVNAGATVIVLDHTGHTQPFVKRGGVTAGRGASSKGQKADVVLNFTAKEQHTFMTVGLELDVATDLKALRVEEVADAIVRIAEATPGLSVTRMRDALRDAGVSAGRDLYQEARDRLAEEDPPRVELVDGHSMDARGRRHAAKTFVLCSRPNPVPEPPDENHVLLFRSRPAVPLSIEGTGTEPEPHTTGNQVVPVPAVPVPAQACSECGRERGFHWQRCSNWGGGS
jgi:hypothetical protein